MSSARSNSDDGVLDHLRCCFDLIPAAGLERSAKPSELPPRSLAWIGPDSRQLPCRVHEVARLLQASHPDEHVDAFDGQLDDIRVVLRHGEERARKQL